MTMPLMKSERVPALPSVAKVLPLAPRRPLLKTRLASQLRRIVANVVPPVVVLALLLGLWELLCNRPGASLPPPSRVLTDTWELIIDPFFDRGGIDKGLDLLYGFSSGHGASNHTEDARCTVGDGIEDEAPDLFAGEVADLHRIESPFEWHTATVSQVAGLEPG